MTTIRSIRNARCPNVRWMDRQGSRWNATLIRHPWEPRDEHEIQVEADYGMPERILCFGPVRERFQHLSEDELELVRRAAQARSGVLWLDPRDGQLWWVHQEISNQSGWHVVYSSLRRTAAVQTRPSVALTLLESTEHQRLLDDAREGEERGGFVSEGPLASTPPARRDR
ncbi:MAG: hypothetical protein R3223_04465 [Longimicrobiales bacterium]|nr:hypothetical protein [Longimicrobiales bacterium]